MAEPTTGTSPGALASEADAADPAVILTIADGIGHIELHRPQAANSIDVALATALGEAAARVAADPEVRAVLISGAGARFCGGGDIGSFAAAGDPAGFVTALAATADAAVQVLEDLPKPVVSAVHGAVAGGGLGIMLAGDLVIAAEDTTFVFGYPQIGLSPDCGASRSLPRAMGQQRALAFALTGRPLTADSALAQGLITEIAPDPVARAREAATAWVAGASGAFGASRRLLRQGPSLTRDEAGRREADSIGARMATPEAQALVAAFAQR